MPVNINNLSVYDFTKICRTCLAEGELLPLFETCVDKVCVIEMLMSCTFIQITEKDGLPEQICLQCVQNVNKAYKFAEKCENNEKILKTFAAKFKETIENSTGNLEPTKSDSKTGVSRRKKIRLKTVENAITEIKNENVSDGETDKDNIKIENELLETETNKISYENTSLIENSKEENVDNQDEYFKSDILSDDDDDDQAFNYGDNDENWSDEYYSNTEKPSTADIVKVRRRQLSFKKGPPYDCESCNINFESYKELKEHRKKIKHTKIRRKISCSVCQKELASSQMKQHMRTHTKERPYVCTYCGRGFSLLRNMKRHMMIHTGERPYKCELCEKAFIQYISLKEHMNKHTGQTPFVCSVCGTTFKYNAMLRKHMRSKHPEKSEGQEDLFEHECSTCHRRYHTKQILRQHMLIHGEKTYLCSVCGKGFYNNAGLQTHIKVHTGHRPHACNVCGKAFRQTSGLKMHVLIHTGEKPFSCPICNKAFTQRNHLRYHMRTHTGEKPYSCTVCGKSFSTNGTLTVHKRTHTGETPYVCSVCGKGFYDSSSMKKHKRSHGEEEQQQIQQNV